MRAQGNLFWLRYPSTPKGQRLKAIGQACREHEGQSTLLVILTVNESAEMRGGGSIAVVLIVTVENTGVDGTTARVFVFEIAGSRLWT